MMELVGKMAVCLIAALVLGFVIGLFFAKALKSEKKFLELEVDEDYDEAQAKLEQMEKLYEAEKAMNDEYGKRNRDLKEQLMKKVTELDERITTIKTLEEKENVHVDDRQKVRKLALLLAEKNAELKEFEKVLIKAEETIEAKDAYIAELLRNTNKRMTNS